MISLETGVPGSGKTLYCIDKLLRALVGSTVKHENEAGELVEIPRIIYTNINGLLLDHEKIGAGDEWAYDSKTDSWHQPKNTDRFGLNNWHEWAKPGSIIVFDEVQKPWPLASSGSRVPPCITALETHRHMGVDFVILTQHPMLIHANVVRLVGRHLHIRRMGNMALAIVYEWDTCSRTLLYKNAIAKSPYRYGKDVYKLYRSAELHTKTPRKIPSLVFGVIFGVAAFFGIFPSVFSRITDRINPQPVVVKPVSTTVVTFGPAVPKTVPAPAAAASQAVAPVASDPAAPEIIGCGSMRSVCRCYDKSGIHVDMPASFCSARVEPALPPRRVLEDKPGAPLPPQVSSAGDVSVLSWMARPPY